jgi:hypothetical protein
MGSAEIPGQCRVGESLALLYAVGAITPNHDIGAQCARLQALLVSQEGPSSNWKCQITATGASRYAAFAASGAHACNSHMLGTTPSGIRPLGAVVAGSMIGVGRRGSSQRRTNY